MALTKKDKEEIKQLVVETIATIQAGAEKVEQDNAKFNLEQLDKKWRENGIRSETTGLIIAPEDVNIDGKTEFTWDEAMALEKEGKIPEGWRLPTRHEWVLICEEFGQNEEGRLDSEKLTTALNLHRDEDGDPWGEYWSGTATSTATGAYYLDYDASSTYPQDNNGKAFGALVRCVGV